MQKLTTIDKVFIVLIVIFVTAAIFLDDILVMCAAVGEYIDGFGDSCEKSSIADYLVIEGNYDNETPRRILTDFLPEQIAPDFVDATYHYKAIKGDGYACEVYLAFSVLDAEAFASYKALWTANTQQGQTLYDGKTWEVYTGAEDLYLHMDGDVGSISMANVQKLFVSDENQRFVFWVLLDHDGGYATTEALNYVSSRYGINLWELTFAEID